MSFQLDKIKRRVLYQYAPFAKILTEVEFIDTKEIPIAGTNGKVFYYNSTYLDTLSIPEQVFVMAHELCHIALRHHERMKGKNIKLWNYVTDAIINQFLKKDGPILKNAIDVEGALAYDSETLYEKYLQNKSQKEIDELSSGHDSHELWNDENQKKSMNGKAKEVDSTFSEREFFSWVEDTKKELLSSFKEELQRRETDVFCEKKDRSVDSIGSKTSLIEWSHFLREAMSQDMDWSYLNSSIEYGVVRPNLDEIKYPMTEVLLDTSGSIQEDVLKSFLKECKNILRYTKLRVGCFDNRFYGFYDIHSEKDLEEIPLVGGGGTDFTVALESFSRKVENKVLFTDGEGMMPKVAMNVLWIVVDGNPIKPLGGRVIPIHREQLFQNKKIIKK